MGATDKRTNEKFYIPLMHPKTNKECSVPPNGWRYTPETLNKLLLDDLILFGDDHTKLPRRKILLQDNLDSQMSSVYRSGYRGKPELDKIGVEFPFAHSTEFYEYLISVGADSDSLILDHFGGSGTTGHAVINLNREDGGQAKNTSSWKWANTFETVTKPRIQKVIYAKDWKDGKPNPLGGTRTDAPSQNSHCFKTIRLESYEDALNNLKFIPH